MSSSGLLAISDKLAAGVRLTLEDGIRLFECPDLLADIKRFLEQMVARDAEWMHNNPEHSDCDRMNADSHLRAVLLGHHVTLQVSGGEVVLGQWQRILMAELDGPRARSLRIQIFGIS